ncbi:MAG: sulfatase-like hydrolase/transferase [Thermoplasmata archaeon]
MDLPNIIMVVFDTLRKDYLYNGIERLPNINEFCKDSNIFPRPITPSPWTVPSHMSFFTGLYAREHGVHEDMEHGDGKVLEKIYEYSNEYVIKKIKNMGYNTIGYSTNPWLSPGTGFDRYFNSFSFFSSEYMNIEEQNAVTEYKKYGKNRYHAARNLILSGNFKEFTKYYKIHKRILKKKRDMDYPFMKGSDLIVDHIINSSIESPFFIFINFMEMHEPSASWEEDRDDRRIKYLDLAGIEIIDNNKMQKTKEGYERSLINLDKQFGRLINYLKKLNIYNESMIILTSDHGQAMKENRKFPYYGHGNFLYDEIIEVPLIIKFPGNKKLKIFEGNQNLVNLPGQILNVIEGNIDDFLTKEEVFSESFGPVHDIDSLVKEGILPESINIDTMKKNIFYPRKAIYKNKYKMVLNGLSGEIEEFTFNGKDAEIDKNKEIIEELKNELYIFKGTEKFII